MTKRYELEIGGDRFAVAVESIGPDGASVVVNGVPYVVTIANGGAPTARPAGPAPGAAPRVVVAAPARPGAVVRPAPATGDGAVAAPLPGLIVGTPVAVGERVAPGDVVVRVEAMKMENDLRAPHAGVVREVRRKVGDQVALGEILVVIGEP